MDLLYSKLTLSSFRRARGPVYSANEGALPVSSPWEAPGKPPEAPEAPEITRKDRPTDAHGAPPPTHAYIDFSLKKSNSEAIILKACIDIITSNKNIHFEMILDVGIGEKRKETRFLI